jgi:hypothetical protein
MPANKYTKALYKTGTVKNERMAEMLRERLKSPMPKEGTTNPSGGRPAAASKMMAPKAAPAKASRGSGMGTMSDRDLQIVKGAAAAARARAASPRGSGMGTMSDRDLKIVKSAAAKAAPAKQQVISNTVRMKPTPAKKK